jgi:TonB family protein
MKRNIYLIVTGLVLFSFGCTHELEKTTGENYTPPTVKEQPKLFYPVSAQENSVYGTTKASLRISKTGTVEKVFIFQSAGSHVLDQAVNDFCKKLVFNPAIKDGEPIESRIIWQVNFNFANEAFSSNEYLKEIGELYELANHSVARERMALLKSAIEKHITYINKNSDALNFNVVMSKLVSNSIVREWRDDWNSYPLSFLIFDDFIKRFSDYDSISYVKAVMFNSLKNDLQYIKNFNASTKNEQAGKDKLIEKIEKYISKNYPDQTVVGYIKVSKEC